MEIKICNHCKRELTISEFGKNSPRCRMCNNEISRANRKIMTEDQKLNSKIYSKNYRENNKEQNKEVRDKWAIENREKLLQDKKDDYIKNRQHYNKLSKEWSMENNTRKKTMDKLYYENNKSEYARKSKVYYEKNKTQIQINNKHYRIKYSKSERGSLLMRMNVERRRSLKKMLPSTLTIKQWTDTKNYFKNRCCYCGQEKILIQEHFIPLVNKGEYTLNNIVPACQSCNSSKGPKTFENWYPTYKNYSKKREKILLRFLGYLDENQQLKII